MGMILKKKEARIRVVDREGFLPVQAAVPTPTRRHFALNALLDAPLVPMNALAS